MRRRDLLHLPGLIALGACAPTVQGALIPAAGFRGPRLEDDHFVSFDGARLGLTQWLPSAEPTAVVVALHGMNDYANAFHLAGPVWAEQGVAVYAIDQRGFGRSPGRGVWAGEALMTEDLRTLCSVVRRRHPRTTVAVVGESMGGAVAMAAFASDRPPDADRLVLAAPAVWGWTSQPLPYKTTLWFAARVLGNRVLQPPSFITREVRASDNIDELRAMGRDRLMIWGARIDALYGLVALMERGYRAPPRLRVLTAYLYGANDQIIPKPPSFDSAARLPRGSQTAYYAAGYHLLLRDLQRQRVFDDVAAFIHDPKSPLPSGAPRLPASVRDVPKLSRL